VDVAAFQITRFPVTVAEYACFVRTTGHPPPSGHTMGDWGSDWATMLRYELDHPMAQISWDEAKAYANWLTQVSGQRWRLPTEAEWDKAARWEPQTGKVRIYPWGNAFEVGRSSSYETANPQGSVAIDAYPSGASPCGAWDMVGNVSEWTSSLYRPYPYMATDGREDPHTAGERVIRGGNWWQLRNSMRAAARVPQNPDIADEYTSFRLVRVVDPGLGLHSFPEFPG
jgi:formylglycine-generating enzyme required for sulfatase activity